MSQLVDYTESFPEAILAQGKATNFLSMQKLDAPIRRADGKRASYALDHRWLSETCLEETDQAWACVQGADYTYWQRKEIEGLLRQINSGEVDIFDHFSLT